MIKIRNKVFETNSSSTHSVVILNNYNYVKALEAACPEIAAQFEEFFNKDKLYYTREEVIESFKNIGAGFDPEKGVLDLSSIDDTEYDFDYVGGIQYADPAHKLLLVLTALDYGYIEDNDYQYDGRTLINFMEIDLGIEQVIKPSFGYIGINHQCVDELVYSIRHDIYDFVMRKDTVLVLSHD